MEDSTAICSSQAPCWSIAVKTVGGGVFSEDHPEEADHNGERNFTVTVSPEDGVTSLHDQIEQCTGLKASQQRLIYRGRLIGLHEATATTTASTASTSASTENAAAAASQVKKLKEIAGLGNGQTIHLVKKRDNATENETTTTPSLFRDEQDNDNNNSNSSDTAGSASLLAALLGLGSPSSSSNNNNNDEDNDSNTTTLPETTAAARRWGGWRSSSRGGGSSAASASPQHQTPRRRPHYRLTTADLVVPDPGSMESVRQGLLTLHTLAPHARRHTPPQVPNTTDNNNNNDHHPLSSQRTWYRGQWLDCRDTVNQWLEATVVEIVSPQDIIPGVLLREQQPQDNHHNSNHYNHNNSNTVDPAVHAGDLEGRRRLLLEHCDDDDDSGVDQDSTTIIEPGWRFRDSNTSELQLLLLHYNGWPHRWDEWIRSDSERIRPFRTRTRHSNTMVRIYISISKCWLVDSGILYFSHGACLLDSFHFHFQYIL
jgi:hypothetical protein